MRIAYVLLLASVLASPLHAQLLHQTLSSPIPTEDGGFGISVSSAGDFDQDGTEDVLIGAWSEPVAAFDFAGRAYIYSGADGSVLLELTSPTPETNADFGFVVERIGDLNADTVPDFAVAATQENIGSNSNAGRVHLFSGQDGTLIRSLQSPNVAESRNFGDTITAVPDLTSDGVDELLIGASDDVGGRLLVGRAYLFNGATGALIRQFDTPSTGTNVRFGESVAAIDDVNADGFADLLIGSWQEAGGEGRAYLFSGATGGLLRTHNNPVGSSDPNTFERWFGWTLSAHPDINADGIGDYVIGTLAGFVASGKAYVYSGASGDLLRTYAPPLQADFAFSLSIVEDFDGDDVADPLFGDWIGDDGGGIGGAVRAFSGATGAPLFSIPAPNPERSGWFGYDVAALPTSGGGDRPGFAVGASGEDDGATDAGRAYLYTTAPFQVTLTAVSPPEPVAILPGSRFDYEITVTAGSIGGTTQVWTRGETTSGTTTSILLGPREITLAPGESRTIAARQRVPSGLPPGDYVYRAFIGSAPSGFVGSDAFAVEVVAPSSSNESPSPTDGALEWAPAQVLPEAPLLRPDLDGLAIAPNPSRDLVAIRYVLAEKSEIRLAVMDARGREVAVLAEGLHPAGEYTARFDSAGLPSGLYLVRLATDGSSHTKRVTILR